MPPPLTVVSAGSRVQIEAGKMQLETVGFDIGAMLESLVDMFSVQCTAKGLEIALDMKGERHCQSGGTQFCRGKGSIVSGTALVLSRIAETEQFNHQLLL
jgi:hypothetical protein